MPAPRKKAASPKILGKAVDPEVEDPELDVEPEAETETETEETPEGQEVSLDQPAVAAGHEASPGSILVESPKAVVAPHLTGQSNELDLVRMSVSKQVDCAPRIGSFDFAAAQITRLEVGKIYTVPRFVFEVLADKGWAHLVG